MPARKKSTNPLESIVEAVKKTVGGGTQKAKRATKKTTKKKATKKRK